MANLAEILNNVVSDSGVDVTSLQPLLTNPVTGTGTTNYLPKWTGTTSVGNSLVFDDGTNVGIGTATPGNKFQVVVGNVDGIRVESSNSGYIELGKTGAERWAFRNNYNSNLFELMYGAAGATPLTSVISIFDNGNFQLGSTGNQGYRLFVNGSIGASGNIVPNFSQNGQYINATTALRFFTNSTERAQITNGGNVLIGTTTDGGQKFQVSGTSLFTSTINVNLPFTPSVTEAVNFGSNSLNYGTTGLNFNMGSSAYNYGTVLYVNRDYTNTGTQLTLSAIDITNNWTGRDWDALGTGTIYGVKISQSTANMPIYGGRFDVTLTKSNPTQTAYGVYSSATITGTGNAYSFYGAAGVLYNAGNVGIGYTSPAYKLDVNGTGRFSNALWMYSVNTADDIIYFHNGSTYIKRPVSSTEFHIGNSLGSGIQFFTTSEMMRITHTGNVGIGTTSPGNMLIVRKDQNAITSIEVSNETNGGSASARMVATTGASKTTTIGKFATTASAYKIISADDGFIQNQTGSLAILADGGSTNIKFAAGGSSTSQMTLFSTGNFAIGTTTDAGFRLDVNGTARVTSGLEVNTSASTSVTPLTVTTNTTSGWGIQVKHPTTYNTYSLLTDTSLVFSDSTLGQSVLLASTTRIVLRTGSSNTIAFGIGGSTLDERLRIDASLISINANQHDTDTRISGDTVTNLFYVDASTDRIGVGTSTPVSRLSNTNTQITDGNNGASASGIQWTLSDGGYHSAFYNTNTSTSAHGLLIKADGGNPLLVQGASNAWRLAVMNTGNVLIGTTTDAGYKVNIDGSLRTTFNTFLGTANALTIVNNTANVAGTCNFQVTGKSYFSDAIVVGAISPNASALLDISSTTKGFLPPRMTLSQRGSISSPAIGLIVYQTDGTEGTYEFTSAGWRVINSAGSSSAYTVANITTTHTETATSGTKILKADTTGGAFTITLPTAVSNTATIVIKKTAGSGALTIDGAGSETIDGGLTAVMNEIGSSITLISDNSNWQII